MRKEVLLLPILLLFLSFCACSSEKSPTSGTESSSLSEVSTVPSDSSVSKSETLSASTVSQADTVLDEEESEEAVPVEDENSSDINEAFLPDYDLLAGKYETQTGTVAQAIIESFGCEVTIKINMDCDERSHYEWELTAVYKDKKLQYENGCCMKVITILDDTDYEVISLEDKGYFEVKGDKLYWTGSSEDKNRACIFVKVEQ